MSRSKRTEPRKTPRQTRSRATVEAIQESAARILERDGYEAANVNEIARVAGVSTGSLYQYYPTKEALVASVAQKLTQDMLAVFVDGLDDLPLEPFDVAVRGIIVRSLRAFRLRPALRKVILEQVPEVMQVMATRDFDERLRYLIVAYLVERAAQIRATDLDLAARILMVSVEAVAGRLGAESDVDQDRLTDELTTLVVRFLSR
jgi:AcrR family transcriptional regulator